MTFKKENGSLKKQKFYNDRKIYDNDDDKRLLKM